jgi:hypothetical protein
MMHELTLSDQKALRAAIEAEAALDYDIQIGGNLPVKKPVDPIKLKEQLDRVRLYSLLFGELKRLLHEVDFGCGAETAYTEGRQRVIERMQSLTLEQDAALKQLLTDSAMLPPAQLHSQLRQQLHSLLTTSDWQLITATALSAVEAELLRQVTSV